MGSLIHLGRLCILAANIRTFRRGRADVERWFSALTTKKLQRSAHRSVKELATDIEAWVANWNQDPTPFVWHKTAEQILERIADYCAAVNEATGS